MMDSTVEEILGALGGFNLWKEKKIIVFTYWSTDDKIYRETGWLRTCGVNRDRVPQPRWMQMKCFFQLGVSGGGQGKKLEWYFYLHPSWPGNSVPVHPACSESPRLTAVEYSFTETHTVTQFNLNWRVRNTNHHRYQHQCHRRCDYDRTSFPRHSGFVALGLCSRSNELWKT